VEHSFQIDYRAIGLTPNGNDILIQLIDLQLGFAGKPGSLYILGFILDGWSQREIARKLGVHHSTIQKQVRKIREFLG
jgi:hypothetical protein